MNTSNSFKFTSFKNISDVILYVKYYHFSNKCHNKSFIMNEDKLLLKQKLYY